MFVARVVHHRAVELLRCAPALAPLEVLYRVRAVRHRLQAGQQVHARLLQLAHRLPIHLGGRGFHQREGPLLQRAHPVVVEGGQHGLPLLVRPAPAGIAVVAREVQFPGETSVVQAVEGLHQVGGDGQMGRQLPQRRHLRSEEVLRLVGDEAPPGQVQPVHGCLPRAGGAAQLLPAVIGLAPEARPPGPVQLLQRAVAGPEPFPEGPLAKLAVARAAQLVGDVPAHHGGMVPEVLRQRPVHPAHEVPVHRGGEAVVVPPSVEVAQAVLPHPEHLRVPAAHPRRARAAGRRQEYGDAVFMQPVQHIPEPAEVVPSLLRLQRGPGEYAHAHQVTPGQLHQPNVLRQNVRPVPPLIRIVVAAMPDEGQLQFRHAHSSFDAIASSFPSRLCLRYRPGDAPYLRWKLRIK